MPVRPWRKRSWIPWVFVAGFAVVIAANAVLVLLSLSSWPGLETENAYERGLAYDRTLSAAEAQAARGWSATVTFDGARGAAGRLALELKDDGGEGVAELSVEAFLVRPASEGFDRTVRLAPQGGGLYASEIEFPLPGVWEVRLRAEGMGTPYYVTERIWVPE